MRIMALVMMPLIHMIALIMLRSDYDSDDNDAFLPLYAYGFNVRLLVRLLQVILMRKFTLVGPRLLIPWFILTLLRLLRLPSILVLELILSLMLVLMIIRTFKPLLSTCTLLVLYM